MMTSNAVPLLFLSSIVCVLYMTCGVSALQCQQCDQRINNTYHCLNATQVNCSVITGVTNASYQVCTKILTVFGNGQSPWVQSGCNLVTRFNVVGFCNTTNSTTEQITTCTCNNVDYCNGASCASVSFVALALSAFLLVAMQRD